MRYSPGLNVGAYMRQSDELLMPYEQLRTEEIKANACHELSHAVMDRYYAGKELKRAGTEAVGYIVQMIYLRVAKPDLKEGDVKKTPLAIESFRAAGEVIKNKKVSPSQFQKVCIAVSGHGLYKNQKAKITYNGI